MIRIKVPATSANLGPGFDTLGLALDLYHEINVKANSEGNRSVHWHHPDQWICDDENLVIHGIEAVFEHFKMDLGGFSLEMVNCEIPASRGLGSSAAAYVSGVAAGLYLCNAHMDKELMLKIATDLEGHPDNVAPAIFGGLVASCCPGDQVIHQQIQMGGPLKFIGLIPEFKMSTHEARAALPDTYSKADVVYTLSRLSVLLGAFSNGDYKALKFGTQDLLHQPHRMKLMPDTDLLKSLSEDSTYYGGFVSGAGSTFMLMCSPDQEEAAVLKAQNTLSKGQVKWAVHSLNIETAGIHWEVSS